MDEYFFIFMNILWMVHGYMKETRISLCAKKDEFPYKLKCKNSAEMSYKLDI
jgi:hypothetical protein